MPLHDCLKAVSPTPTSQRAAGKLSLTNMQARLLSVSVLVPSLSYLICYSKFCTTCIVCFCMLCAGLEWSGVKRHLKVQLLLWSNNMNANETLSKAVALSEASSPGSTSPRCQSVAPAPASSKPSMPSALANNGNGGGSVRASHDMAPMPESRQASHHPMPHEYDRPVVQLSLYSVLKHLGWTFLAIAAHYSELAFLTTLAIFFLVFVAVTLIAHNRLELKVQEAADVLSSQLYSKSHNQSSNGTAMSVAEHDAQQFCSMELLMIAEKQPAEQFLDFSLDIFGILWVSGLAFALFTYSIPQIGLRWTFGATMSNFFNDICALLVGKSLKQWHARFRRNHHWDAALDELREPGQPAAQAGMKESALPLRCLMRNDQAEAHNGKAAAATGSLSAALTSRGSNSAVAPSVTRFEQWVLRMPHPLYAAISPNKSLEGAIAGVLASALSFTMCMYAMHPYDAVHLDKPVIAPRFDSVPAWVIAGLFMGVMGVMGDLLQSLLKRSAHLKDTGALIPGHGGILDRVDGMLLLYPFVYSILSLLQALS